VVDVGFGCATSSLCGIEEYIYNNTNYFLLGVIIRRTTGKSAGKGLGHSHREAGERGPSSPLIEVVRFKPIIFP
jgi:hypothetical protein